MNGEGSIYRRASDGRWVAALSTGRRGDRVIQRRYARTRAEARAALDELRAGQTMTGATTAGDFLGRWVDEARDIRPATRAGYRAAIVTHIAPAIGGIRLVDLTPLDVESMLAGLQGSMSQKTLRNLHSILRRALGQAVRAGLAQRNVASREFVDAPKVDEYDPRVLTPDEERRLVAAARGDRIEALIVTALGTGLRLGELLGLAWEDIEAARLRVRKELVYRDGRYSREEPKTPRSKRTVPLAPHVAAALDAHRDRLVAAGFVPTSTGPVFVNTTGGALSGSWVTHHFYDLLAAAGVERLPFKNLRSTFGSRLFDAGVPDRTIADLMGHTRTRTTQKHYIATTPEQAVAAVARLAG